MVTKGTRGEAVGASTPAVPAAAGPPGGLGKSPERTEEAGGALAETVEPVAEADAPAGGGAAAPSRLPAWLVGKAGWLAVYTAPRRFITKSSAGVLTRGRLHRHHTTPRDVTEGRPKKQPKKEPKTGHKRGGRQQQQGKGLSPQGKDYRQGRNGWPRGEKTPLICALL